MIAQDFCFVSVLCKEDEIPEALGAVSKTVSNIVPCKEISKKEFVANTSRPVSHYLAKMNDTYDYLKDRKTLANYLSKHPDIVAGKIPDGSTTLIQTPYYKLSDLDIDIDPTYFMIESHFIEPRDYETSEVLPGKLFIRIIINKAASLREEGLMIRVAEKLSRNRVTEFLMVKPGEDKKPGMEMYYQYAGGVEKEAKSASSGLFTWYRDQTGIDIATVMEQVDRNIDMALAPQMIADLKALKTASQAMVVELQKQGIDDVDVRRDNEKDAREIDELIKKNQDFVAKSREGSMMATLYMRFTSNITSPKLIQKETPDGNSSLPQSPQQLQRGPQEGNRPSQRGQPQRA